MCGSASGVEPIPWLHAAGANLRVYDPAALPKLDSPPHTALPAIAGRPPDPTRPMPGCSFAPRCRYADELCHGTKPELADPEQAGSLFACWHPLLGARHSSGASLSAPTEEHDRATSALVAKRPVARPQP